MEWLLSKTIEVGRASGAVADKSLKRIAVDTTVMEKTIAHPTDARLYERARALLASLAKEAGIELRQSYARLPAPLNGMIDNDGVDDSSGETLFWNLGKL